MDVEGTRPGGLLAERFLLRRQLGRGGAATVWQATDLQGGLEVAVKLLHPRFRSAGPVLNRLRREAELLARLDHPSIARAVALELDRAQPFFVMELVDGHGLDLDIGARADLDEAYADATIHTVMRQL
jgi:serine/threonine protein kinase